MGYLTNFIVYTLAMVGVIMLAILVCKVSTNSNSRSSSKFLKVHDTLSLGPRKTLYIVSAGEEKFLIAGDVDKTNLISKLETQKSVTNSKEESLNVAESFSDMMGVLPKKQSYIDKSSLGVYSSNQKAYSSVMKNLAERIKAG